VNVKLFVGAGLPAPHPYNPRVPARVEKLERQFAAWLGVPHAIATGSGRSALFLALAALDAEPGEVLVPELVCSQVPEAVRRAGHRPVIFPVREDLVCLPSDAVRAITPETRAVILVHYYGRVQPHTQVLVSIFRQRGLPVIEDCALALDARNADGANAGRAGDAAVFSFTKSAWCYGGGIVAARSNAWADRMRDLRTGHFRHAPGLLAAYGCLRRADFAANRPAWSTFAGRAGPFLEKILGGVLNSGEENSPRPESTSFYDSLSFDLQMSPRCARRALRLHASLPEAQKTRLKIRGELSEQLRGHTSLLVRADEATGDSGAFLLLQSSAGRAAEWRDLAAREGVTLRLTWPAFQSPEAGTNASRLDWIARHLLVLEIHERLTAREVARIATVISRLAETDSEL